MLGQRKAAIAVAATGTAMFVLGWAVVSRVVPISTWTPIAVMNGTDAPASNANDGSLMHQAPMSPDAQEPGPDVASAPKWRFGDDDHHQRGHDRDDSEERGEDHDGHHGDDDGDE